MTCVFPSPLLFARRDHLFRSPFHSINFSPPPSVKTNPAPLSLVKTPARKSLFLWRRKKYRKKEPVKGNRGAEAVSQKWKRRNRNRNVFFPSFFCGKSPLIAAAGAPGLAGSGLGGLLGSRTRTKTTKMLKLKNPTMKHSMSSSSSWLTKASKSHLERKETHSFFAILIAT